MSFWYIHLLKAFIQHGIWSLLNACYCLPISKCLRISIDLRSCRPISCRWRDWPYKVIRWLEPIKQCVQQVFEDKLWKLEHFIVIDNSVSLMHTTFTPVKCIEQETWNCFRHRWFTHDHEYNQFPCHLNKHLMQVKGSQSCTRIKISVDNWTKRCIRRK